MKFVHRRAAPSSVSSPRKANPSTPAKSFAWSRKRPAGFASRKSPVTNQIRGVAQLWNRGLMPDGTLRHGGLRRVWQFARRLDDLLGKVVRYPSFIARDRLVCRAQQLFLAVA